MDIIIATRNPSKLEEIAALFAGAPRMSLRSMEDAGIKGSGKEDFRTLTRNALAKADYAHTHAQEPCWALADDTGLFIDGLGGEPGVHTARWAGESATTEEITRYCLKRMEKIENRAAQFKTVVAIISPKGQRVCFDGMIDGILLRVPRVTARPKMPYGCLFVPQGETRTFAEMSIQEENAISHRGIAFRRAIDFLKTQ